jgi:hypothetical protein
MTSDRSRYGLLVSALGAILLAVSVFLPWYGVSFTHAGTTMLAQLGDQFAQQLGNATMQSYVGSLHGAVAALAGQQLGGVSAHQVLSNISVVLLVLAGLALLDALLPLARSAGSIPEGAGRAVVLLGLLASAFVLYRMLAPPTPAGGLIALSLREGAWLSLAGALMIALGGVWPRALPGIAVSDGSLAPDIWTSLSGWTPSR